jgi:hypothetical protein
MRSGFWCTFLIIAANAVAPVGCERPPLCPEVPFDQEIAVPATSTTTKFLVERFSAHTNAAHSAIAVSIVDNQGTIFFEGRGPLPAFVYVREPFPAAASTLYAGIAVEDGAWFPFWLYCADDGRLTTFYGEMTDRALAVLTPVDGSCVPTADWREMQVDVPGSLHDGGEPFDAEVPGDRGRGGGRDLRLEQHDQRGLERALLRDPASLHGVREENRVLSRGGDRREVDVVRDVLRGERHANRRGRDGRARELEAESLYAVSDGVIGLP